MLTKYSTRENSLNKREKNSKVFPLLDNLVNKIKRLLMPPAQIINMADSEAKTSKDLVTKIKKHLVQQEFMILTLKHRVLQLNLQNLKRR